MEAVVVPIGPWKKPGNLADFFLNSPLRGAELDFERHPDTADDFDAWMRRRGTFESIDRLADALNSKDVESR